jgi:SAM-dependent methyltransferase/uncharacterized protein YbaR (Trm112 family)
MIDSALLEILRCPECGHSLGMESDTLVCIECSGRYLVVQGIPLLIPNSAEPTHKGWEAIACENTALTAAPLHDMTDDEVSAFLEAMIVPTCGNLFKGWSVPDGYPIPDFPEFRSGAHVLDVGCNWGRWTIAGAKAGYRVIGVDIHLQALRCARQLAHRLVPDNEPHFVLADARYLPFAAETFDGAFSYGVIQHFSKRNAVIIFNNISRILRLGAKSVIQMPNIGGIIPRFRVIRGVDLREGSEFDVRWYSLGELTQTLAENIGDSIWSIDCFLGLNVHARDRKHVKGLRKLVVDVDSMIRLAAQRMPIIGTLCDSVFITSTKERTELG